MARPSGPTIMVADAPVAGSHVAPRSPARERRLRQMRQNARVRLRLVADVTLLTAHHSSQPPCGPPAQPGLHAPPSLRVQFAALQASFDALLAVVEVAKLVRASEREQVEEVAAVNELAEVEETHQALGVDERKASAVAALLSAVESRQVESLQLALTVAEAAGLEDQDLFTAKRALAAEQRKASAQAELVLVLQALEVGTLEVAVRQGQLAGSDVAGLAAAMTALARVEDLVVLAREASALASAVLATDRCPSCHGHSPTLGDACPACHGRVRLGQLAEFVNAEASMAASTQLTGAFKGDVTGWPTRYVDSIAAGLCGSCCGAGRTLFGICSKCSGNGKMRHRHVVPRLS